jgi:hypothetical protein
MRNLILSAALVAASLFGMTAQAADVPLEAGKTYVELATLLPYRCRARSKWWSCSGTAARIATLLNRPSIHGSKNCRPT